MFCELLFSISKVYLVNKLLLLLLANPGSALRVENTGLPMYIFFNFLTDAQLWGYLGAAAAVLLIIFYPGAMPRSLNGCINSEHCSI